jgi:hypothetical protein
MTMLQHAFKEWAAICAALAQGRQTLILRKGGIAEDAADFRVEHTRFWLYPTYVHQQQGGVKPAALGLLEEAERDQPPPGKVRLQHWCEVTGIYRVHDLLLAQLLDHLHLWSEDTVTKRFQYRTPGLNVLVVRVHCAAATHEIDETAAYAGCKSWVALDQALPDEPAVPVMSDERFERIVKQIDGLLRPTALA